jgi:organic radical activating enzyme
MKLPELHTHEVLVNESFFSLQGEGYFSGKAAFFIRFAGCDIGCSWCDTKDVWAADSSHKVPIRSILEELKTKSVDYVVITGGEPFIHDLRMLTTEFKKEGVFIHIETSGAYEFGDAVYDWISLSPKRILPPLRNNYSSANELKVVVQNNNDLEFALEQQKLVQDSCKLYLQPQWEKSETVIPMMVEFILHHPQWQLSLQTHKYIHIP